MEQIEEYNQYGEIIKQKPKAVVYERGFTSEQLHRIHETKDYFDGECYLCQRAAQRMLERQGAELRRANGSV